MGSGEPEEDYRLKKGGAGGAADHASWSVLQAAARSRPKRIRQLHFGANPDPYRLRVAENRTTASEMASEMYFAQQFLIDKAHVYVI